MELGKKIKQLRFKAGLTQEQLAEKLGIAAQSVSKWETAVAMPDITTLPLLAEIFGTSIDDLFDLTSEQRLNRIENSLDITEELPQDLFREYEDFLKTQLDNGPNRQRATSLISYLYWHRMNSCAKKAADRIMEDLVAAHPEDSICLFEAAQYYAKKSDYQKAIGLYERSFEAETRRPRFTDELMAIADIYEILGDYRKAAETYDRIIDLLENEWGFMEDTGLKHAQNEKARLLAKA